MTYIMNWSDNTDKPQFEILPRDVNNLTSVVLYGKGAENYGEGLQENILRIMENFSSDTPPANPTKGQMWYNRVEKTLNIWDGTVFTGIGSITASDNAPTVPVAGNLWFDTVNKLLNVWDGTVWNALAYKAVLDSHINNTSKHLTPEQGIILNNVSSINLNQAISLDGITSNIQSQLNDKVKISGDTMTGFLNLNANPIQLSHAANKKYVDTQIFNLSSQLLGTGVSILYENSHTTFAASNQTVFNVPWSYTPGNSTLQVFVGGIKMEPSKYVETNATTITFAVPIVADTSVAFHSFKTTPPYLNSPSTNGISSIVEGILPVVSGQVGAIPTFIMGSNTLLVWKNGVKMIINRDYTEVSSTSINFGIPLLSTDIIDVLVYTLDTAAVIQRETIIVNTIGQTNFVLTTPYTYLSADPLNPQNEGIAVFANGVYQSGPALIQSNGTSVKLQEPLVIGDTVEVYINKLA